MILGACHRGVAAVVVTHDAQLASWADRVVFIRDGRLVDQTVPPPTRRNRCSRIFRRPRARRSIASPRWSGRLDIRP